MKIVCENCNAKYSIADEKVKGKAFKIRCKKCGESIVIRGDTQPAAPAAEPSVPAAAATEPAAPVAMAPSTATIEQQFTPPPMPADEPDDDEDAETRVFDYSGYQGGSEAQAIWHIVVDGEQQGPLTADQVNEYKAAGKIDDESFAWREGYDDWKPLKEIDEIQQAGGVEPAPAAAPVAAPAAMSAAAGAAALPALGASPLGVDSQPVAGAPADPEPPLKEAPVPDPIVAPTVEQPAQAAPVEPTAPVASASPLGAGGGGLFDKAPAAGGGLFDKAPAADSGGGLFGQTGAATEQAAPAAEEAPAPVASPAAEGGLFDSAPVGGAEESPAVAGQDSGPGDVFSSASSGAAAAGGGLFGGDATGAAGDADGGGLFAGTDDGSFDDAAGDLFGGAGETEAGGGIFASTEAPAADPRVSAEEAMMTGQRNENSVLFSLSNLQALAGADEVQGGAVAPGSAAALSSGDELSGLIDIRSMAQSISTDADGGSLDDILSVGGSGFAPSLGAPVLAAAPQEGMSTGVKIGIIAGGVAFLATLVVVLVILLQPEKEPESGKTDQQIAVLLKEIQDLKKTGGGSAGNEEKLAALKAQLAQAETQKGGDEANGDQEGTEENAENSEATSDKTASSKKGKASSSKKSSGGSSSKSDEATSGGSSGGSGSSASSSSSSSGSSGSTSTSKKKHDELDDLLGGAMGSPPKKKKPASSGSSGGNTGGGSGGGGGSVSASLSRAQVQKGMNAVAPAVKRCGQGGGGSVTISVSIAPTGRVTSASPVGAHAGTPVGMCAARAVRRAKFPKTQKTLNVKYPFRL